MTVVHLSKAFLGRFPEVALRELGFEYGGKSWGNDNLPYFQRDMDQSTEIYVVNFDEVWICIGTKYRKCKVGNVQELKQLISVL